MTDTRKNLIYNISIYYLDNRFYVVGLVRMPPIGIRTQVHPVYTVIGDDKEELAKTIEAARLESSPDLPIKQINALRTPWDGNKKKVWNNASKSWEISWYEDGSVEISSHESYDPNDPDLEEGKAWRGIKDGKKLLSSPVSSQDIAKEIMNQAMLK